MAHHYINTPQISEATYSTHGGGDELGSPEKSFAVPAGKGDLISQMRSVKGHGMNFKTPRAGGRDPLRLLANANHGKPEFTPLMRSVTKNNIARRLSSKKEEPSFLRNGYTPGGPRLSDLSHLESERTSSSAGNETPMPQNPLSSANSTPLPHLPSRDAGGLVNDGNMMTLREQENIIDKIEKENFGLKMKIHFLEEALSKRGHEFNQAALKENTDLKVNKITMQRELHKFKKNIYQAEKDAELYRLQLEEFKERIKRKQADDTLRMELETLRTEVKTKERQIRDFEADKQRSEAHDSSEIEKLRGEIEDLQLELRDKDNMIDDRDDKIDELKARTSKTSNEAADMEDRLSSAQEEIDELRQKLERAMDEAREAREDRDEAAEEKRKAEENLEELQDEMANKSFTTKGLSRQLEEKANKLEDDLEELQEQHKSVQAQLAEKTESERQLRERVRDLEKETATDLRKVQQEVESSQQQRETLDRKLGSATKQLESIERDLQVKIDEKDLLQSRHDALTTESAQLQRDLTKAKSSVRELEQAVDEERHRSAQNETSLRAQHKHEIELLTEQIDGLHRDLNSRDGDHQADLEEWQSQQRILKAAAEKAEEKASGLQRTIEKLNDAQGTMSGREMRLQEALESEKQRHGQEEKVLSRQIEELQQDLAAKRSASEENRSELNNAKEELRISIREQAALKEKVAELEEEIEVLQADIEQEHEFAERQSKKYSETADNQVQKIRQEKQILQDQLSNISNELSTARSALKAAERDRDGLEVKLASAQKSADDTFNVDMEKRELKRGKVKLESELDRLKSEKDALKEANQALEDEINAEIDRATAEENRLNAEIDGLRNQKILRETRDRELAASEAKTTRMENRIRDLEDMLENQSKMVMSPGGDASGLRRDLAEARKNESMIVRRETEMKAANRDLKIRVNELEKELHEAKLAQYKAKSPSSSPSLSNSREIAQVRQELLDAEAEVKILRSENRDLKRTSRRQSTDDNRVSDLQAQLKSRTDEAKALQDNVNELQDLVKSLQEQPKALRDLTGESRDWSVDIRRRDRQISELKAQIKVLRESPAEANDVSMRLSVREGEARQMKLQLKRLREERSEANQKAEAVETELEAMQAKYESILEKLSSGRYGKDEIREKEVRGLIKEIMWLKAKCKREERLRKDLAWSKGFLEQGEVMRSQCNQVDLRILGEMGVSLDKKKYATKLSPVQKFRAGVFVVMAAIRMSNMEEQWRDAKLIGEELKVMRMKQMKRLRVRS